MSDLGIALCWGAAFVVFILFDVWAYFYQTKKNKKEEEEYKEFMAMVEKQRQELIDKGIIDEYGNPLTKNENGED